MTKKIFTGIIFSLILILPAISFAQTVGPSNDCTNSVSTTLCNPVRYSQDDIGIFALKAVSIASTFFVSFAVIFVVYSGFRMIISQGNEEDLTVAKSGLQWSLFGLILAMFAFVIINAIGSYLGTKAVNSASYAGNNVVQNPLIDTSFAALLTRMLTGFLSVVGILAIFMIVIGGFRYVTSGGNEEQAESGKKTLQWAIIGLVVALLSYVLVRATATLFGG